MTIPYTKIRNVAIIAHVDHGKTTLVDGMLRQSGLFRANQEMGERILDSGDLERERGITILAKNTSLRYAEVKINIIDTPGHADFGGEVERTLKMADGVLLLVDAKEGPMPQTKFVLRKALALGLKPIVVLSKTDRADARVHEVVDEVLDLFIELGCDDHHLDFPIVYTSGKQGTASRSPDELGQDLRPLFEAIVADIPPPFQAGDAVGLAAKPLRALATTVDHNDYLGRMIVARIFEGTVREGMDVRILRGDGGSRPARVTKVFTYEGLERVARFDAGPGEIVALTGASDAQVGDTVAAPEVTEPIPYVDIDKPTLEMFFSVNDGPFAGKEGTYVTSRKIWERLERELLKNVSLRAEQTEAADTFRVRGRGELHLSILVENMRREGYELLVGKPHVVMRSENGVLLEPMEDLVVELLDESRGIVMEKLGKRRAEIQNMQPMEAGWMRLDFVIPARGLIGFRSEFLTDTRGSGIMYHTFREYGPHRGEIRSRETGTLVSMETGEATAYALSNLEARGSLFLAPGNPVYSGQIVGESPRASDIPVNPTKKKHLTNMRASTADEAVRLSPPIILSLEQAIEFIADDELVEVTPTSIRLRKKLLSAQDRKRSEKQQAKLAAGGGAR